MNAYTLLMKVVLDVKQEKEEVKVATLVFSKDDDRDKMANKTKIAPKEVKEVVVDYAVEDFDHDLVIDFSDYGTEANATAKLSLQKLNKIYHHILVWCFLLSKICTRTVAKILSCLIVRIFINLYYIY